MSYKSTLIVTFVVHKIEHLQIFKTYIYNHTCPFEILVKRVFLSFNFSSRSIKVSLFVLTWNLSLVNNAPDILL